jgi:hypothetical protein
MSHRLKAQEKVPVLARDGRTSLGYCQVAKFSREPGQPSKEISISDMQEETVAVVYVYKLHSRVNCGPLEIEAKYVDSKHALAVARAALENGKESHERLLAIQAEAELLDALRKAGDEAEPA